MELPSWWEPFWASLKPTPQTSFAEILILAHRHGERAGLLRAAAECDAVIEERRGRMGVRQGAAEECAQRVRSLARERP